MYDREADLDFYQNYSPYALPPIEPTSRTGSPASLHMMSHHRSLSPPPILMPLEADYEGVTGLMTAELYPSANSANSSPYHPHPFDIPYRRHSNASSIYQRGAAAVNAQRASMVLPSDDHFVSLSYPVATRPTSCLLPAEMAVLPVSEPSQGPPLFPLNGGGAAGLHHPSPSVPSPSPLSPVLTRGMSSSSAPTLQLVGSGGDGGEPDPSKGPLQDQPPTHRGSTMSIRDRLLQRSKSAFGRKPVENVNSNGDMEGSDSPSPALAADAMGVSRTGTPIDNEERNSDSGFTGMDTMATGGQEGTERGTGTGSDDGSDPESIGQEGRRMGESGIGRRRLSGSTSGTGASQNNTSDNETVMVAIGGMADHDGGDGGNNGAYTAEGGMRKASVASGSSLGLLAKLTRRLSRHITDDENNKSHNGDDEKTALGADQSQGGTGGHPLFPPQMSWQGHHSHCSNPSPLLQSTSGPEDFDFLAMLPQFPAFLFQQPPHLIAGVLGGIGGVGDPGNYYYMNRQEEARQLLAKDHEFLRSRRWRTWTWSKVMLAFSNTVLLTYSLLFTSVMVKSWIGDPAIKHVLDSGIMMIANRNLLYLILIGYVSYRRGHATLYAKLKYSWIFEYGRDDRLVIQNALSCCGYRSTVDFPSYDLHCFPRAPLPPCEHLFIKHQEDLLANTSASAFTLVGIQLFIILVALMCSNHVDRLFRVAKEHVR
ncbi:hypothetical protein BGZ73_007372 [Actinomortierella ambigua]|nr:hypothetical protein BGZ73_007372 [Actinomortierella ambigua]